MNVRPAIPADVAALVALARACPTAAHWGDAEYARIFQAGAVPRIVLVAEESAVAGFIVARTVGPEWELENIVVSPELQKRGIGLQLISSLRAQASARQAEAIVLEVRASNQPAQSLYRRAGFAENGRRPAYYANPTEDAVLYRLDLRQGPPPAP